MPAEDLRESCCYEERRNVSCWMTNESDKDGGGLLRCWREDAGGAVGGWRSWGVGERGDSDGCWRGEKDDSNLSTEESGLDEVFGLLAPRLSSDSV